MGLAGTTPTTSMMTEDLSGPTERRGIMPKGKKLLQTFTTMLAIAGASGASAETLYQAGVAHVNPLLGHWHLSRAEANGATSGAATGCSKEIQFEPDNEHLEL